MRSGGWWTEKLRKCLLDCLDCCVRTAVTGTIESWGELWRTRKLEATGRQVIDVAGVSLYPWTRALPSHESGVAVQWSLTTPGACGVPLGNVVISQCPGNG